VAVLVPAVLLAGGCGGADDSGNGDGPLVVATTTILGDVVAGIVGDAADVEVLMPVGADPHSFQASARQAALLREADLVVANGLGLEEGLSSVIEGAIADGATVVEIGPGLDPIPLTEAGDHDEDEGDHHDGDLDPHVWMDPVRMVQAVDVIATALDGVVDGPWREQAAAYKADLQALDAEIRELVDTIPVENRRLVTSHLALSYFAQRYGFEMIGAIIPGGSTSAEPSPSELAGLAEIIRREGIPAIFGETTSPTGLSETLAGEVGFDVAIVELYTGSLSDAGGPAATYLDLMRTDAARIAAALGGA
jgi:zinc/manganese transport system substrate-binding protein